jgi:superfamily I DNA and/or RNA helicase
MAQSMDSWIQKQRTLLDQERSAERTEIADSIATLTAAECQLKGLSLLSLAIKGASTGLYGRTVLVVGDTKGRPLPAHQFSSGNEVTLRSTKGGAGSGSVTGVIGKVTDEVLEVVVDDDAGEAEALKAPLRMDVLANEATHKKLLKVRHTTLCYRLFRHDEYMCDERSLKV